MPQIHELLAYESSFFWFDGDWKITQKSVNASIRTIINTLDARGICYNDRIGKENKHLATWIVNADRYIPDTRLDTAWQHINTIGLSWGYNKEQEDSDYKTGDEIFALIHKISELGGTTLINIGPDHNGNFDPNEFKTLQRLKELVATDTDTSSI